MNKEFVPYDLAVQLKELGFDEECFMIYYNGTDELRGTLHFLSGRDIKAPLWQQAFDWFLEKHELWGQVSPYKGILCPEPCWEYRICNKEGEHIDSLPHLSSKQKAREECLKELIEICKKKE